MMIHMLTHSHCTCGHTQIHTHKLTNVHMQTHMLTRIGIHIC